MSLDMNRAWWEKMVAEGNGFTQPWLDLGQCRRATLLVFFAGNYTNPGG